MFYTLVRACDELYAARNIRPRNGRLLSRSTLSTQVRHISTAANYIRRARNEVVTRCEERELYDVRGKTNYEQEQVEREIVWGIDFGRPNRGRKTRRIIN